MKTKTYPLLWFGDKILSIRETVFRRSRRRNHNRERTTIHKTNEKFVIQQAKDFCSEKKIQLTLAHKNSLTSNNLYCKKVLRLFQIQQILTGLI